LEQNFGAAPSNRFPQFPQNFGVAEAEAEAEGTGTGTDWGAAEKFAKGEAGAGPPPSVCIIAAPPANP